MAWGTIQVEGEGAGVREGERERGREGARGEGRGERGEGEGEEENTNSRRSSLELITQWQTLGGSVAFCVSVIAFCFIHRDTHGDGGGYSHDDDRWAIRIMGYSHQNLTPLPPPRIY